MATLLKSWIDWYVNYLTHIFKTIQAVYKKCKGKLFSDYTSKISTQLPRSLRSSSPKSPRNHVHLLRFFLPSWPWIPANNKSFKHYQPVAGFLVSYTFLPLGFTHFPFTKCPKSLPCSSSHAFTLLAASGAGPYSKLSKISTIVGSFFSFAGPECFSEVVFWVSVRVEVIFFKILFSCKPSISWPVEDRRNIATVLVTRHQIEVMWGRGIGAAFESLKLTAKTTLISVCILFYLLPENI